MNYYFIYLFFCSAKNTCIIFNKSYSIFSLNARGRTNSKPSLFHPCMPPPPLPTHIHLLLQFHDVIYLQVGCKSGRRTVAQSKHAELENHFSQNKDPRLSCFGSRARSSVSTKISKNYVRDISSAKKMFWSANGGWGESDRPVYPSADDFRGQSSRAPGDNMSSLPPCVL